MKSYLVIIIFLLFSFISVADEINCSEDEIYTGKLFKLDVGTPYPWSYEYNFCVGKVKSYLVSSYQEPMQRGLPDLKHTYKVLLSKIEVEKIKELYLKALFQNPKNSSRGKDGSTWCFKPKSGMGYSNFCHWSPDYRPTNRNLSALNELKIYIHQISGLEEFSSKNGE